MILNEQSAGRPKSHLKAVSRRPASAQTTGQVKYDALATIIATKSTAVAGIIPDFELMIRSAPWGVVFDKSGGTTS